MSTLLRLVMARAKEKEPIRCRGPFGRILVDMGYVGKFRVAANSAFVLESLADKSAKWGTDFKAAHLEPFGGPEYIAHCDVCSRECFPAPLPFWYTSNGRVGQHQESRQ